MKDLKILFFIICISSPAIAFSQLNEKTHQSDVYNREKPYNIYFPDDYTTSTKDYPVVYYFHGWGGDHTQSPGSNMNLNEIKEIVNNGTAIFVMVNGRSEDADQYPYNIGDDQAIKYEEQFKDYFLEIVQHIDDTYRTLANRENRALMGFSMGGFISFYLAGKYPDMVSTAVNFVGSPELDMGYPDNHTLYAHRYTMGNLHGVNLRFHNSESGELSDLNKEVHEGALWEKGLSYMYKVYPGGHRVNSPDNPDIFKEAYQWVLESINNPLPKPERWNHLDLYPDFSVWDYEVSSNLDEPGYIEMKGVTNVGMRIGTKKWLPRGVLIQGVTMTVKTAPIYDPNSEYTLFNYNQTLESSSSSTVMSDAEGSIMFTTDQDIHHYGFINSNTLAEVVFVDYMVDDTSKFFMQGKEAIVKIKLLNRGGKATGNLQVKVGAVRDNVNIIDSVINVTNLAPGETAWVETGFVIAVDYSAPSNATEFATRFNLEFADDESNKWIDEFDVPVIFDVLAFSGILIDDGVKVANKIFGEGNGNGIADPGETVMLYVFDDKYANENRRLRLYYDDPYVELQSEEIYSEIFPSVWVLDGTTVSSIIKIADNCPQGHVINCLASYEYKEYNPINRIVTWGLAPIGVGCNVPDPPNKPRGISKICQGSSNTYYKTDALEDVISYKWTITPNGAGEIIGEGNEISIAWSDAFSGNAEITVRGANDCLLGSVSAPLSVTVFSYLDKPEKPTGDSMLCVTPDVSKYSTKPVENAMYYKWFISPNEAGTISGADTIGTVNWSETFLGQAEITVKAYMACSESELSDELSVKVGCSLLSNNNQRRFKIYPNPAKDFLMLEIDNLSSSFLDINIVDIKGQLAFKKQVETINPLTKIDLTGFSKGVYFIKLKTQESTSYEKLIVE